MNKPTEVCWDPAKVSRHQSWKDGRPASTPPAENAPQVDVFAHERAGIIERLSSALHPSARWRDPREVGAPRQIHDDATPFSARAAQAIVWLRKHPDADEAPAAADALWCIVMQEHCAHEMLSVATALARDWRKHMPRVRRMAWDSRDLGNVEYAAGIIAIRCASGVVMTDKPELHPQLWRRLQESGVRTVWDWADHAATRASRAFR